MKKRRVYKILCIKLFTNRKKGFWKYFYSLSDLVKYAAEAGARDMYVYFPNIAEELSPDEFTIFLQKYKAYVDNAHITRF